MGRELQTQIVTGAPAPPHPERLYDWPTLVAITLVVYALSTVLHEGIGHGGACLLMGDQPRVVSTVQFECSRDTRLVMAGGTLANLLAGLICLLLLQRFRHAPTTLRYFLWLSMTINLLRAAGYVLYSGVGNIGDWSDFIMGLGAPWIWRAGMIVVGTASYWMFIRLSLTELLPFIGAGDGGRVMRAHRLTLDPYLAGGVRDSARRPLRGGGSFRRRLGAGVDVAPAEWPDVSRRRGCKTSGDRAQLGVDRLCGGGRGGLYRNSGTRRALKLKKLYDA